MRQPVVIIGAGGVGREVLDVVNASNRAGTSAFEVLGFLDDVRPDEARLGRIGASWLGPVATATSLPRDTGFLIAIGRPEVRRLIEGRLSATGLKAVSVVHPMAWVGSDVRYGPGTVICANASLTTNIRLGSHVQIHVNATVGHDCVLGDRVTVSPSSSISGNVRLEDDVTVGTGACVIQGLRVGAGSTVGAGAAVVRDVPEGVTVKGVPARP